MEQNRIDYNETAAIRSIAAELVLSPLTTGVDDSVWNESKDSMEEYKLLVAYCAPCAQHVHERFQEVQIRSDLVSRASPRDEDECLMQPVHTGLDSDRMGLDSELESMSIEFNEARRISVWLIDALRMSPAFGALCVIHSHKEAIELLDIFLDKQNPFSNQRFVVRVKKAMLKRIVHIENGKRINRRIEHALIKLKPKMSSSTCFLETLGGYSDILNVVLNWLAPRDAVQLICSCRWDLNCAKVLRHRLPALRIFELTNGQFPHAYDLNGNAIVHKASMLNIVLSISILKRMGHDSIQTVDPNTHVFTLFGLKQRADELMHTTVPAHAYFSEPPTISIKLVDAATGEAYDTNSEFGGLVPDRSMQALYRTGKKPTLETRLNLHDWLRSPTPNLGTLVRFSLKKVSKCNRALKLLATASGMHRRTKEPFSLHAESVPFYVVSSKVNAERILPKKRKVG